jgi:hypothetical protein
MARLDLDRQKQLEPKRINHALNEFEKLNIEIISFDNTKIIFKFKEEKVTYFPYSGWHSGKSIVDGRGFENLKKQLK